jgi:hypothetical protein
MILARVENAVPKTYIKDSGYYRVSGNEIIAEILQRFQSTVISGGNELEVFIEKHSKYKVCKVKETRVSEKTGKLLKNPIKLKDTIPNFEDVIYNYFEKVNSYFPKIRISKEDLKKHADYDLKSKKHIEIDGVWVINGKVIITEYKDGYALDTKKSDGEIKMLKILEDFFQNFDNDIYLVLWNLGDINDHSIKSLEADKYVITGRDFSKIVGLDFDLINQDRERDQEANKEYFVKRSIELLEGEGYKIEAPV